MVLPINSYSYKIIFTCLFLLITIGNVTSAENTTTVYTDLHLTNITEPQNQEGNIKTFSATNSVDSDISIDKDTSQYIKDKVGESYFNEHFEYIGLDNRNLVYYAKYDFSYGSDKIEMRVAYDLNEKKVIPQLSYFITKPINIEFSKENALTKAEDLNLSDPKQVSLVYIQSEDTLAWKVIWDHEPTDEERANSALQGYVFDAVNGDLISTYNYHIEATAPNGKIKNASLFDKTLKFSK